MAKPLLPDALWERIRPDWVRLDVPASPKSPLVAAFREEDGREVAVLLINPGKTGSTIVIH